MTIIFIPFDGHAHTHRRTIIFISFCNFSKFGIDGCLCLRPAASTLCIHMSQSMLWWCIHPVHHRIRIQWNAWEIYTYNVRAHVPLCLRPIDDWPVILWENHNNNINVCTAYKASRRDSWRKWKRVPIHISSTHPHTRSEARESERELISKLTENENWCIAQPMEGVVRLSHRIGKWWMWWANVWWECLAHCVGAWMRN